MAVATSPGLDRLSSRIGATVRARRLERGLSLSDLARRAGLSRTILTRIEAGVGNPSVETLWHLHRALEVPLAELLGGGEDDGASARVRTIPARSGETLRADSGMRAWYVHAEVRPHRSEVYELELPAGVEQVSGPHLAGTQELVTCLRGRIRVGPDGAAADLRPGDAVWFAADVPHRYRGLRDGRAQCLILHGLD